MKTPENKKNVISSFPFYVWIKVSTLNIGPADGGYKITTLWVNGRGVYKKTGKAISTNFSDMFEQLSRIDKYLIFK